MKFIIISVLTIFISLGVVFNDGIKKTNRIIQHTSEGNILGTYINDQGDCKIEIYKLETEYFGKIIHDDKGKIKIGTNILLNLKYMNGVYKGKTYLPAKNKKVDVSIKLKGNVLKMETNRSIFREKRIWKKLK